MNKNYEDIKLKFIDMCKDKSVSWTDELLYMIYSEYPLDEISEDTTDSIVDIKSKLRDYNEVLWEMQPTLEDDVEVAFAIQHIRDIINVLLK